jgi:CheY-like chemotaxis protein
MQKVMLIEDDHTLVGLLKTLLEIEGFLITIPDNLASLQICAVLRQEQPDAVLMDVNMRGANGLDLLREIRQAKDLDGIPVIMTSGMHLEEQCLAAGAAAFVLKPFIPDQLISTIRKAIKSDT